MECDTGRDEFSHRSIEYGRVCQTECGCRICKNTETISGIYNHACAGHGIHRRPAIDDKEKLLAGGYDLEEIGIKLIDNYIKQVMEDGFFHADPHPGNVKIQDGKIVWIDMGMMGRLTERDKELIGKAIRGIAENDIGMIQEAVMALGEFKEKPDQSVLYEDISELMSKYGSLDMERSMLQK